jgi:diacylglycerol O-acyltransferase / trehalose O-mycolyltransferase
MRRQWLLVLVLVLLGSCSDPSPAGEADGTPPKSGKPRELSFAATEVSERIRDLEIQSPALGGTGNVRVVLPPGYATETTRRWPVLYLLHGCCGDDYQAWTDLTDIVEWSASSDVLLAIPEGGRAGFYSDWQDGPQWETFHLTELRSILEAEFRAGDAEAVVGTSMGGFGALSYAARHPGRFRAAVSLSGVADVLAGPTGLQGLLEEEGEEPDKLWGDPVDDRQVWQAHNPSSITKGLRGTEVHLYCGTGRPGPLDSTETFPDNLETLLHEQNVALAARLKRLEVSATIHLDRPGTHSWAYWEREIHRAWPGIMTALKTPGG